MQYNSSRECIRTRSLACGDNCRREGVLVDGVNKKCSDRKVAGCMVSYDINMAIKKKRRKRRRGKQGKERIIRLRCIQKRPRLCLSQLCLRCVACVCVCACAQMILVAAPNCKMEGDTKAAYCCCSLLLPHAEIFPPLFVHASLCFFFFLTIQGLLTQTTCNGHFPFARSGC